MKFLKVRPKVVAVYQIYNSGYQGLYKGAFWRQFSNTYRAKKQYSLTTQQCIICIFRLFFVNQLLLPRFREPMDGLLILEVGRRIKQNRIEKRLTLQELADKSGVSKGLVSQIENGRSIPSLPVMFSIIQSLEVEVSEFFKGLNLLEPTILIQRKEDYIPFEKEDAQGFNYQRVIMRNLPASTVDFVLLELSPNCFREEVTTDAYEYIYIIGGETDYLINGQIFPLKEGDSVFFDGRLSHVPKNNSESPCKMLVIYFFTQH